MSFDADLTACAALVERADPLRFRTVMAAPVATRHLLFPLYAFNVEVARAPWVTQEAMIAEMRLQWWRDVCEEITKGGLVRRHEVATPLAGVISAQHAETLDQLVAARRWDAYRDPFEDAAHFDRYIDQTSGNLMWVAAQLLGAQDEQQVRDAAYAAGLAAWFLAIPDLTAQGRIPMVDGTPQAVRALANEGLARFKRAAAGPAVPRGVAPAFWPATLLSPLLQHVAQHPGDVVDGNLQDPTKPRLRFALKVLWGRW